MNRKPARLTVCILCSIAILTACAKPTEIVPMPLPPTDTQVPAKTPLKPTATQVSATKTPPPPTDTPAMPTQTLEPSPTTSSINGMSMIERVSVASDGTQANNDSNATSISDDGRYIAFSSLADNLVEGDTNGVQDVFVHDLMTGETTRVSVASDGTQANGACATIGCWCILYGLSISADGRFVAFHSDATNLVEGDTNGFTDIFVHDRVRGETTLVSVSSDGTQGNGSSSIPSISADGRYVAFLSDSTNLVEGVTNGGIFVHDRVTGKTTFESVSSDGTQGNEGAGYPTISADGRYVAFSSFSDNLVQGDTNGITDIFVHDRVTGETTLDSVSSDGAQGNGWSGATAIAADGRYVAFWSEADNLVEGDTNEGAEWFVHDRVTGETTLVTVPISGDEAQGNEGYLFPYVSADGRYCTFISDASNLVEGDTNGVRDVFVRHLGTGKTEVITPENAHDLKELEYLDNSYNAHIHVNVEFSPNGDVLAAAYSPGPVRFYNMATFEMLLKLETRLAFINSVAFSPDGKLVAVGGRIDPYGGGVQIWDMATQKQVLFLDSFKNIVVAIAFSPNGAIFATGDGDPYGIGPGSVKTWDVATGELLSQFSIKFVHGSPGYPTGFDIAFNPEGTMLATGNGNGQVQFWDVAKNTEYKVMTGVVGRGQGVTFSPDGKLFAASGHDSFNATNPMIDLRLWDLTTGKLVFKTESPGMGSMQVTFSPNSQILASVSYDSILLWDIETGNIVATLPGGESVAFSPDGTLIATGNEDGVRLWGVPGQ